MGIRGGDRETRQRLIERVIRRSGTVRFGDPADIEGGDV